tara:strand:- start:16 stop:468 length:453 start_codon:yes stop_codon:yes gene_type:complete
LTEIGFYHLEHSPLERALPKLLEKVVERGYRALVLAPSEERVEALNALLWTYQQRSFLAHGSARDGYGAEQPIYLTTQLENPNGASVLVLIDGAEYDDSATFARCLLLFDGKDEMAVADARQRWHTSRDAGHDVVYWQQTPEGRWQRADD